MLSGKKILLGVTGSIAAYKTALLVRQLVQLKAEVKVVMTTAASAFIPPLTLATLSKNPVAIDLVKDSKTGQWQDHVALGAWADLFVIAPLSAHTLAKLTNGIADNLLLTTYLSATCPVWIAPAMDRDMYRHFSTQRNLSTVQSAGIRVIEAVEGELASGLEGKGRMEEPEVIVQKIRSHFSPASVLNNRPVLITGGPTFEAIDPVRFIGNHSSGKTGVLLADVCAERGAKVTLVTGPTIHKVSHPSIDVVRVRSAEEMKSAVEGIWSTMAVGIFSAAVADYRPVRTHRHKIKKEEREMTLSLVRNPDILKWAGDHKKEKHYLVGFALETQHEQENGWKKVREKHLDLLVLNSLNDKGAGFGMDTNKVTLLKSDTTTRHFELKDKAQVAVDIVDEIEVEIEKRENEG